MCDMIYEAKRTLILYFWLNSSTRTGTVSWNMKSVKCSRALIRQMEFNCLADATGILIVHSYMLTTLATPRSQAVI